MTKMEIATYLGVANTIMAQARGDISEEDDSTEIMNRVSQAICEAQLIMYELVRQDIVDDNK